MKILTCGLLIILTISLFGCINAQSTLRAVSMLTRHGDRSPAEDYPTDPYAGYKWPGGPGALSPKGVRELFRSGLIKASRYSPLFAENCGVGSCTLSLDNIYVQSSSIVRCIESAISFLDAFVGIEWPKDLINVPAAEEDEILVYPGKPCPKYDTDFNVDINSPEFAKVVDFQSDEGQQLIAYIESSTGMDIGSAIVTVTDATLIQLANGLAIPAWAESVYDKYLVPLTDVSFDIFSKSDIMTIRSGRLLKDMIDRLEGFVFGTSAQNIIFYSAHDLTVSGLVQLLEIKDQTEARPSYGAMLDLELHENAEIADDLEVKIFYYLYYGDDNPIDIQIPNCAAPCPFNQFKETVQSKLVSNYDEVCSE